MTAKEYLSQYSALDIEIKSDFEHLKQLRDTATNMSPSTGFGTSSNISDKVGKTVAKIVDLENKIVDYLDRYIEIKNDIVKQINAIESSKYRTILKMHYFSHKSFEAIAEEFNCERSTICRQHGTALTFITPTEKF